jgi:AcrR family transcriptional regulator
MSTLPLPPLDRLPSGRHRLSREVVHASQRGRLLFAIVQVVAEKGYAATTVADIVDRASVSRSTFYEQFPDKEACFLGAFNFGVEFVLGQMREAWEQLEERDDWRTHVRSDLTTFLGLLASEPAFARALHVEVLAAGPAALAHRTKMFELFTLRTKRVHQLAREQEPELRELADEMVREWLRTHEAATLTELYEPLLDGTLALFGDARR